jgi:glycosyltransferase involved in cell wall biosynthesis
MPMVSVIIPNYNHSFFLQKRIDSVLQQSFKNFEVIILDDCSTDDSRVIIETYRTNPLVSHIVYNSANSGNTFHQWKKGIELAKGDYIWLAESDDYCEANFLEVLVGLLNRNPNASLAYCKSTRVNEKEEVIDDLSFWYEDLAETRWQHDYLNSGDDEIKDYLYKKNTIPNASAVVFRRDKALLVSDDYLTYKLSGDWLFWILLLERGDVTFTTGTTNYFRTHSNSVRKYEEKKQTSAIELNRILSYLYSKQFISKKKVNQILKAGLPASTDSFQRIKGLLIYVKKKLLR